MIRKQMKAELLQAMKAGRKEEVITLRTLIAAIDNAEAVPVEDQPISTFGGRNEDVPRRQLTPDDIQQILRREADERRSAAAEYERLGRPDQAEILKAAVVLIERYFV